MTRNAAIKLAIDTMRKYARDYYGWEAKFHPDKKDKYDEYHEAMKILESLKDGKRGENE
jgi:hypothetical protein